MASPETMAELSLANAMAALREKYTDTFTGDDADWARRVNAYWDRLRSHDARTLTIACKRIAGPDYYPERLPTVDQMARVCLDIKRELGEAVQTEAPKPQHVTAGPPRLAEDNPFEQLAQAWEQESQRLELGPWDTPADDVARRRMADLREMWATRAGAMALPSAKPDEPRTYQPNVDKAAKADAAARAPRPPAEPAAPADLLPEQCPV